MPYEPEYRNDPGESLKIQFDRTMSRLKKQWKGEALTIEDINTVKLPAVWIDGYFNGHEASYFAKRNEGGKWNVEKQTGTGGTYGPRSVTVKRDLALKDALDYMAKQSPDAMLYNTKKYWHPVAVAKLIGHEMAAPWQNPKPSVPEAP